MKNLLATIALAVSLIASGQEYLGDSKQEIIKKCSGFMDSSYKISFSETIARVDTFWNFNDSVTHFDTTVTLKVSVEGFEKFTIEYFFTPFDDMCDSISIKYYCSDCIDKHINGFVAVKDRKWKQLNADKYISRKWTSKSTDKSGTDYGSPQMIIIRTPNQPVCATVCFSVPMMPKDKWKQLTSNK
jgi:hypothetical protein